MVGTNDQLSENIRKLFHSVPAPRDGETAWVFLSGEVLLQTQPFHHSYHQHLSNPTSKIQGTPGTCLPC